MRPTPILICGNAGSAGPELLRRRDIECYWALSPEEAAAVSRKATPKLLLVRSHLAPPVLKNGTKVPTVVLVEPDGWKAREELFKLGATALALASSGPKILEATSELTGLSFARLPRVSFTTVAEVEVGGETLLLETANLSASGVAIRGLEGPAVHVGGGATIGFPMLDPPLSGIQALIVRRFNERGIAMAGLAFSKLGDQQRARLSALVQGETQQDRADPLSSAFDQAANVEHEATGDLISPKERESLKQKLMVRAIQVDLATHPSGADGWIDRAANHLSKMERAVAVGEPAPAWAQAVLDTRLVLCRAGTEQHPPSPELVTQTLETCRLIGQDASADESRIEATLMRASLLRELERHPARVRLGTSD